MWFFYCSKKIIKGIVRLCIIYFVIIVKNCLTFSYHIPECFKENCGFQVHGSVHRCNNLNKNANQMYFVLKSLKFYLHYSALHVSDPIVSIIRSFSAALAVSGPVWCLVRCVLQSCYVVTFTT